MKNLSTFAKSALLALTVASVGTTAIAAQSQLTSTAKVVSISEAAAAATSKISLTQAINIAQQHTKGDLVSAEFDYEDGDDEKGGNARGEYEIEFVANNTSYEVKIDANTGAVLKSKQEVMDKKDLAEYSAMKQAKVSLSSAVQKANQSINGTVVGYEFDLDHNQAIYKVKIAKGAQMHKVKVDANTGAILSSKLDN